MKSVRRAFVSALALSSIAHYCWIVGYTELQPESWEPRLEDKTYYPVTGWYSAALAGGGGTGAAAQGTHPALVAVCSQATGSWMTGYYNATV
jgi:hypothetical protein